jgi:hypothetical protein
VLLRRLWLGGEDQDYIFSVILRGRRINTLVFCSLARSLGGHDANPVWDGRDCPSRVEVR